MGQEHFHNIPGESSTLEDAPSDFIVMKSPIDLCLLEMGLVTHKAENWWPCICVYWFSALGAPREM